MTATATSIRAARRASDTRAFRRLPALGVLLCAVVVAVAGCTSSAKPTPGHGSSATGSSSTTGPTSGTATSSAPAIATEPVHVSSVESDGQTYGVAMPIILRFTPAPTNSTAFTKAVKVTVDGQPSPGTWFWEKPYATGPVEAHFRPRVFWKAHSKIEVALPIAGLSAGRGLAYDGKLTSLSFAIGAANVTTVDGATERMTVNSDGVQKFSYPVSLGKAATPTYTGTKVVMELDKVQHMVGTPADPYSLQVPWSVRLTTSGEFIHSASWNGGNIGQRSTSNGCTNLNTADAKAYFAFAQIGDPAIYRNTGGKLMPSWDGYGDWNIAWGTWAGGGLLRNH